MQTQKFLTKPHNRQNPLQLAECHCEVSRVWQQEVRIETDTESSRKLNIDTNASLSGFQNFTNVKFVANGTKLSRIQTDAEIPHKPNVPTNRNPDFH